MFCKFVKLDDNHYQCSVCDLVLYSLDGNPPNFICNKSLQNNEDLPSFLEKVKNFALASVGHIKSGMKLASNDTIISRFNECKKCEFYKDESCSKCGCPVFAHKKYISKLSWSEQECPVGKWGPETT